MERRYISFLQAAVFVGMAASHAGAQSSTGLISGTVRDSTGAVIPNVAISITHLETDRQVAATTNDRGEYVSIPLAVPTRTSEQLDGQVGVY